MRKLRNRCNLHTLQHLRLGNVGFTSALECASIDEVEDDTIRKLLSILIRSIGRSEFGEMEALRYALRLLVRLG